MLFAFVGVVLVTITPNLAIWFKGRPLLATFSFLVTVGIQVAIYLKLDRKKMESLAPVLLGVAIFFQTFFLMYAAASFGTAFVTTAVVIELMIVYYLTIYAFSSNKMLSIDDIWWHIIIVILCLGGIGLLCISKEKYWHNFAAQIFSLIYAWLIVKQLTSTVSKRQIRNATTDYVTMSLILFLDIIHFIYSILKMQIE